MIKFIVGLLIGILVTCIVYGILYEKRTMDYRIELYSIASREYRKGFETGTKWGIELQRHNELMKR